MRRGSIVDVRLTAPDGYQAQRSYSIASAPGAADIELAIERLENGEVSPFFHDIAQPGDAIALRGPIGGHFVWRPEDGGPLLLIAGGSGVAPLMAMARHRVAAAPGIPALLVYSARIWGDLIFRDELLETAARAPNFTLAITTTRGPPQRAGDRARRLDRTALRNIVAQWGHTPLHTYVCGTNAFVAAVTDALVAEAVSPQRIRAERYGGTAV